MRTRTAAARRLGSTAVGLCLLTGFSGVAARAGPFQDSPALSERVERLESDQKGSREEEAARRGARIFANACAACHGRGGQGDGPGAADLDPVPRDLSARHFRFRTTPNGTHPRPEDLERTIRRGLPGSAMPGFGELFSAAEISDLVAFINSLQYPGSLDDGLPEPVAIAPVSPVGPTTLQDGRALYLLAGCWRCHGVNGAGRGPSSKTLTDDNERPIRATDFRYDPFKGGREPDDVVRTLRTGLNGSPMPSYDDAMFVARGDPGDLPENLPAEARSDLERFLQSSPTRRALDAMSEDQRADLRDERMAALAHYVLSLDRRSRFAHRLFRARPELEARKP